LAYSMIHTTRFQCMLIGAIGAILFHRGHAVFISLFTHKLAQLLAWGVIFLIGLNRFHLASVVDNELVSIVALILIMGQITVKNRLISLEGNLFDFLGKISYGMYVLHPLVILALFTFLVDIKLNQIVKYVLVFGGVTGVTILLSYLSYEYFEKWFLHIKNKYSAIKTSASKTFDVVYEQETKEQPKNIKKTPTQLELQG
jgi:peptidoglycan/LPS O-acetylase OafA/YrhL